MGYCLRVASNHGDQNTMTTTDDKLTATQAREFAKAIIAKTHFTKVKASKGWGGWEINIDGGRGACYGKTIETVEGAEEIIRIFSK